MAIEQRSAAVRRFSLQHRPVPHLDALQRELDDPNNCGADDVLRVRDQLAQLSEALKAHHEMEEQGELYNHLPAENPAVSKRLVRLLADHDAIQAGLDAMVEQAGSVGTGERQVQGFFDRARLLVATIVRHEAEETEIVLQAVVAASS